MNEPVPLVRDVDPMRLLGGHPPGQRLQPYVPRDVDAALERALAGPGLTLVVHESASGARRTVYEALLRTRADHQLVLLHEAGPAALRQPPPQGVLWVDVPLAGPDAARVAQVLRRWLEPGRDAVVIINRDHPELAELRDLLAELKLSPKVVEVAARLSAAERSAAGLGHMSAAMVDDLIVASDVAEAATARRAGDVDAEAIYRDAVAHVRRLLRRASLLESDEVMDDATAALLLPDLTDTQILAVVNSVLDAEPRAITWAALRHHLAEDPPELLDGIRFALQRQRIARRGAAPRPHLTRDYWTTDDQLGYRAHADAIATFIRHPDSRPPLTIGIKGPWGAGKTSLMRMIRANLDDERTIELTRRSRHRLTGGRRARADSRVTNSELLRHTAAAPSMDEELVVAPPGDDWRATVWFNPWMYQSTEQVWAGLAHTIIGQVTDRLRPGDRERFWLELNLARLDRLAVRRRAYRLFLERLLPVLVTLALTVGLAAILWLTGVAEAVARWVLAGGAGLALLGGLAGYLRFRAQPAVAGFGQLLSGPTQGLLDEATPDPGYAGKAGFLHMVHHDMRRVLALVATEDRPLVVFVDDLDRCSPGVVAEVIEAVNLFLAGEFENCVFVVAMEPDVLAAHVEVAYAPLVERLGKNNGELGWRFLEKIVQLPMSLPAVDEDHHVPAYLRALLGVQDESASVPVVVPPEPTVPQTNPEELWMELDRLQTSTARAEATVLLRRRAAFLLRAQRPTLDTLTDAIDTVVDHLVSESNSRDLARSATLTEATTIYTELFTDKAAYGAIGAALPALRSGNPREIKRYVNLFRFYSFITFRQRATGNPAPDHTQLAKLAAFAIRWPDLLGAATHAIATLEDAAADDGTWETALDDLGCLRDAPARRTALRTFLTTEPRIGAVAHTVL